MTGSDDPPGDDMASASVDIKRLAIREAVLKSAQIIFDQSVVDCLVLDVSETGARVRTASVFPIPRQVRLRFRGGATFPAERRWARGMEIGFSFATAATLAEVPAELAWKIYEYVRATSLEEPLKLMRDYRFFDDLALEAAAEEAEAALRRLEAMLRALASPRRQE
jgi:hypothetical protein